MQLTSARLEQFEREGYLFFPGLFTQAEIKVLTDEVPALYAQRRPENHQTIAKLVERGGIVAPKGPPGSMILFHGWTAHPLRNCRAC